MPETSEARAEPIMFPVSDHAAWTPCFCVIEQLDATFWFTMPPGVVRSNEADVRSPVHHSVRLKVVVLSLASCLFHCGPQNEYQHGNCFS